MRKSKISAVAITFLIALYQVAHCYFRDPSIWVNRMHYYAKLIEEKSSGAVDFIWGFIDGTLRKTCRPILFQKRMYSGHKRSHGMKFQSVVVPEGLIACLYGPVPGSRHDSFLLSDSLLEAQLEALFPDDHPGPVYKLYGDPAYRMNRVIFHGFRNPPDGSIEAQWNKEMSAVRVAVEWLFGQVVSYFKYVDFKNSQRLYREPIALYYFVACFFINLKNTIHGSTTANYFNAEREDRLTLQEYLDLVSIETLEARLDNPTDDLN
jgi:hypothetical protein